MVVPPAAIIVAGDGATCNANAGGAAYVMLVVVPHATRLLLVVVPLTEATSGTTMGTSTVGSGVSNASLQTELKWGKKMS